MGEAQCDYHKEPWIGLSGSKASPDGQLFRGQASEGLMNVRGLLPENSLERKVHLDGRCIESIPKEMDV